MKDVQSLGAALLYVLAHFAVLVLKPVLAGCQKASDACAKLAQAKLAQLHAGKPADGNG